MSDKMTGVNQLFEIMGMKTKVQLQLLQMVDIWKSQGLDDEVISIMQSSLDIDVVLQLLKSIWAKYYSVEDIMGLIQFYQMPTGKKMLEVESLVQKETEMAFQQLIQSSMEKLMAE